MKRTLIWFLLVCLPFITKAQNDSAKKIVYPVFHLGIGGGANALFATHSEQRATGYSVGAQFQVDLKKHFSLAFRLDFENYTSDNAYHRYNINSLTAPLLARFYIGNKRLFFAEAGLTDMIFFSEKHNSYTNTPGLHRESLFTITAGAGSRIPLGKNFDLLIEARASIPPSEVSYGRNASNPFICNAGFGACYKIPENQKSSGGSDAGQLLPDSAMISRFQIGIAGGSNLFNFAGASSYTRFKISYSTGVHLQTDLTRSSSFVADLLLENKRFDITRYSGSSSVNISYLTLPVMMRFHAGKRRIFFAETGNYISRLLKYESDGVKVNYGNKSQNTELGLIAGMGVRIPAGKKFDIAIEGREAHSFTSSRYPDSYSFSPVTSNTSSILLGISYKLNGKYISNNHAQAEKKNDSTGKQRNVYVKLFYAPKVCGRIRNTEATVLEDSYYGNSHTSYSYDTDLETFRYGQEAGILLSFINRKHFNLDIGLGYDREGFKTIPGTVYSQGWGDLLGFYHHEYKNMTVSYKFDFADLSLAANFVLPSKKCLFYAGAGLDAEAIINSNVEIGTLEYTYHLSTKKRSDTKIDPLAVFATGNLGMEIPCSAKSSVFIEPYAKYEIGDFNIPIVDHHAVLWSAGCRLGLKF
ncbi:MAG: outer membrane beta-barrel protein [Bacteroidia bacterium]